MKQTITWAIVAWLSLAGLAARGANFYVNDAVTAGDVYCSAAGVDAPGNGTNAASPMLSLTNLFASYSIRTGDVVFVDTGVYSNYTLTLTAANSGSSGNNLILQGSTNLAAGGSVIERGSTGADAVVLNGANHVAFRDLTLRRARYGALVNAPFGVSFERVRFVGNVEGATGTGTPVFRRCIAVSNSIALRVDPSGSVTPWVWENGVMWSNALATRTHYPQFTITLSNSIIVGGALYNPVGDSSLTPPQPPNGDYNLLWNVSLGGVYVNVADLMRAWNNSWLFTSVADPLFANPIEHDFHPQSMVGTFSNGVFSARTNHSPAIDFGRPGLVFTNEPVPNGSNVNIGAYGNTAEASLSRTNAWLFCVSFNDGGDLSRSGRLVWTQGAFTNGSRVKIEYSTDNAASWQLVTNGVSVTNRIFIWNATTVTSSPVARWRITGDSVEFASVSDTNDQAFVVRGLSGNSFFVNDTNLAGDVYATAPGSETNSGLSAEQPAATLQQLLNTQDVGPGDTVFVDTGLYPSQTVVFTTSDQGLGTNFVTVQGSTNMADGGSIFMRASFTQDIIQLQSVEGIRLRDLSLRGGRYGVNFAGARGSVIESVTVASNNVGFYGSGSNHVFRRCTLASSSIGVHQVSPGPGYWSFDSSVFMGNTFAVRRDNTTYALSISNSVVVGGTFNNPAGVSQPPTGDYTLFWNTAFGALGTLSGVQKSLGSWWHSTVMEPTFVNSSGLDFHEQSITGTFSNGSFYASSNHSPAIDFASPVSSFAAEPAPNGSRANAGPFGGTPEAGMSRTNEWLMALTFRDGGTLDPPADIVYWNYGNLVTGATVRIEFNGDGGEIWDVVATNLLASAGQYTWSFTNLVSSRFARWRVVLEGNTNVMDATTNAFFTFRNGPFFYYINDASTAGDVYTTATGSDANIGTTPGTPKRSLQSVIKAYDLFPGDVIFVDTGTYALGSNNTFTVTDTGSTNAFIEVRGSTNLAAGGSVFNRGSTAASAYALELDGASYIRVSDLVLRNAGTGLRLVSGISNEFRRVRIEDNGTDGVSLSGGNADFDQAILQRNISRGLFVSSGAAALRRSVIYRNTASGVRVDTGTANISNSIVNASGASAYAYFAATTNSITGDYNAFFLENNALVGFLVSSNRNLDTAGAWTTETQQDRNSTECDPQFANAAANDFHLKTETPLGRTLPNGAGYTNDTVTSPLIDAAAPQSPFANEPAPNGRRMNIGYFGNSPEASIGNTNAAIFVASFLQGGYARGTNAAFHWVARGAATSGTVRIELTTDGATWAALSTNTAANAETIFWNTTAFSNTPAALWRVRHNTLTNATAATTNFFAIRNAPLSIFVNDDGTTGDIYTAQAGSLTNFAATAANPARNLATVFTRMDLEPGDRVFVDTGTYSNEAAVGAGRTRSGSISAPVLVIGSTNESAAASVLVRSTNSAGEYGLTLNNAASLVFSNLTFRDAGVGVRIATSSNITLSRVRLLASAGNGIELQSASAVSLRRVVAARSGTRGLDTSASTNIVVENSVIISNVLGAVQMTGGGLSISNSVLKQAGIGTFIFNLPSAGSIKSDFNNLPPDGLPFIGKIGGATFQTLEKWQAATGGDIRSLTHDPLFADAGTDDYHPLSEAGRTLPGGTLTNDAATSPMIDAASATAPFAAEPAPNGARANIGLYGNDTEASRSRTNGWLLALSYNAGGTARGTNALHWLAGGIATGHTVTLQYSGNNGLTWSNIVTGIAATNGSIVWNSLGYGSSAISRWRIVSGSDTNILDATDSSFILNNGPLNYYVNDTNTIGDVYTVAAGSLANDGVTPSTPKASIQDIVDTYVLSQGDRIFVDTGIYDLSSTLTIAEFDSGVATNALVIRGSTNFAAGGTVLNRIGGGYAIRVESNTSVALQNLRITNASPAIIFSGTTNASLDTVSIVGGQYGVELLNSVNVTMRQVLVRRAGVGIYQRSAQTASIAHSVLWSNTTAISLDAGTVQFSNSVIGALAPNAFAYSLASGATLAADHNDLWLRNGARAVLRPLGNRPAIIETVSRWSRDFGQDRRSLTHDPLFADIESDDFHPMSSAGRFTADGSLTNDLETSPLVDGGAPGAAFTNETAPNGARVNIGLFANHPQASRTPTNAVLRVLSFNDGGRAEGVTNLFWQATGSATGHLVRILYSSDGGASWVNVASGLTASAGSYLWDSTIQTSSLSARWRILSETDLSVSDTSDTNFALRNVSFNFFVNDAATTGDVFTVAAGSATNSGLTASEPRATVQSVLDSYDIEPGDIIYVDTGSPAETGTVTITEFDAGVSSNRVVIRGSTNLVDGGTVFVTNGFALTFAPGITLRDIAVQHAVTAVKLTSSDDFLGERLDTFGGSTGYEVNAAHNATFSNCAARGASSRGLYLLNAPSAANWQFGVLWSNVHGVRMESGSLTFRNSVIGSFGSSAAAFYYVTGTLNSDYNNLWLQNGAAAGFRPTAPFATTYQTVSRWVRDFAQDAHSLSHDPLFGGIAAGDSHLWSSAGRWLPVIGNYTNDPATSPLLDAADPAASFANEPLPNGGRADIGRYGNDAEASLSPTNASLTAVSLNDGGRAEGTVTLNWIARGNATGDLVTLEFSADNGASWSTIASGIAASTGTYEWASTGFPSTAVGRWRITGAGDTNANDITDAPFALRNTALNFYVNDTSTVGDVYCSVIGSDANDGVQPSTPKLTLQALLAAHDLEAGDRVFVDSGTYPTATEILVGIFDAGSGTNRVAFIGSTNSAAGGTIIERQGGGFAFRMEQAASVELRSFRISGAGTGVRFNQSDLGVLEDVSIRGGSQGIEINDSDNVALRNFDVSQASSYGVNVTLSSGTLIQNGVLWSNFHGVYFSNGGATISNTVIGVFGAGRFAYNVAAGSLSLVADYNNIIRGSGAAVAYQAVGTVTHQTLSRWTRDTGRDVHSLSHDPIFPTSGTGDFHLASTAGRFVPGAGYTNDSVSSPLLDAGAPSAAFANETTPNGSRLDIGRFGNHPESSLISTSASLTVVSLNDGGRIEGTNLIAWVARGSATGHTVRLDFTPDNGASWTTIVSGVAAATGGHLWDTTEFPNSVLCRWRITDEVETNVWDTTDFVFDLRNGPISFYVNDASAVGDVYCITGGSTTNPGVSPATPKASVQDVLDTYDLEPGDTIYVDTGSYTLSAAISIGSFDTGAASNRVSIVGSTNAAAGGSIFNRFGGDYCILVNNASGIGLRHLTLRNAVTAARLLDADFAFVEWVRAENSTYGFDVDSSSSVTMRHNIVRGNSLRGINNKSSTTVWENGVIWSNAFGVYVDGGTISVRNTALGAFQSSASAFFVSSGTLLSDYNALFVTNGAHVGLTLGSPVGGGTSRYVTVAGWTLGTGRDARSLSADPRFVNPIAGDFHLRSTAGRFLPGTGFVNDAETSPLLDAADPATPFNLETAPNGGRANIGAYGRSAEASRSPTNSTLTAVSFNDGGAAGGLVTLYWIASGNMTGQTVRLAYSSDGGATFSNIVTGVAASDGQYSWDSSTFGSSAAGVWRIAGEIETNIADRTDSTFYLRNGSGLNFYVNDSSTTGDVFTTATGAASNLGYLAASPMASVQQVLEVFDLEPGDRVFVDTGTYNLTSDITIGDLDAGSSSNMVVIEGSTNLFAGGTLINRQLATTNTAAVRVFQTTGIEVKNLRLTGAGAGVRFVQSPNCRVTGVHSEGNTQVGFNVDKSSGIALRNSLAVDCAAGIQLRTPSFATVSNCVVWNSGTALDIAGGCSAIVRNSVLQGSGGGARVYRLAVGAGLTADYNNLVVTNGAFVAEQTVSVGGNDVYQSVTAWQLDRAQDTHSLAHFPGFGNVGAGDFHPLAKAGRYVPGFGFTNDAMQSVLVDAGDPSSVFTNETLPNGGRINIGLHGDTSEASRSSTQKWLVAVTFNDGGTISGTNTIFWNHGAFGTGDLVHVQYSLNNGIDWFGIASNVAAQQGSVVWDVSALNSTVLGLWRVTDQSDTGVTDRVDANFTIRTAPIGYFVNDGATTGDVYATAAGSPTNSGTSAASPMSDLGELLARYTMFPGDTVYVDTGIYGLTNSITLNELVRGETGMPVKIYGSTNVAAGGTVFNLGITGVVMQLSQTRQLQIESLSLRGGTYGLSVANSESCTFSNMEFRGNSLGGVSLGGAFGITFDRSIAQHNGGFGLAVAGGSTVTWRHGVVFSNQAGAVSLAGATLALNHSVLHARGATNPVYQMGAGAVIASDYNHFWRQAAAPVGRNTTLSQTYANMVEWAAAFGQDANTLNGDPLFADASAGDFHEQSEGGRSSNGVFVADVQTSPLVDSGNPASSFANETAPNGSRVNIGLFGNNGEASRTPPDPRLVLVTLADGGTVRGTTPLRWIAQGFAATNRLTVQYSADNGSTWTNIATNIAANTGSHSWNPEGYPSSPAGLWRLIGEDLTNVVATLGTNFFLRTGPVNFYVNNGSTNGDIFCTAPGSPANLGLSPSTPAASLQQILDAYDVDGGDTILWDTGTYTNLSDTILTGLDGGIATARVRIVGSTNIAAGGTVLDRGDTGLGATIGLTFNGAQYVALENLTFRRAGTGLQLFQSLEICASNISIHSCGAAGIKLEQSSNNRFGRTLVTRQTGVGVLATIGSGNSFDSCIIWSNGSHAVSLANAGMIVSNSILQAYGAGRACFGVVTNGTVASDYNNLVVQNGAVIGPNLAGLPMESLTQWSQARGVDIHSLSVDPLFVDAATDDYHVRSLTGRFDPISSTFVTDTNHSYMIDTASPTDGFADETAPNGARRNIGLHGGMSEASRSRTNAWLLAVTANSGGRLAGDVFLNWAWGGGLDPTNTVALDYSFDDGVSWTNIASGVAITSPEQPWDSAMQVSNVDVFISSPIARWRVVLESNTNVTDMTDTYFSLRNSPFVYYVNDTTTNGDVFTTSTGSDTNLGLFAYAPKATLASLLSTLDVEGSDVIVMDTGTYNVTNSFGDISATDGGTEGNRVIIHGSTNGTVIRRVAGAGNLLSISGPDVQISDVQLVGGPLSIGGARVDASAIIVSNGSVSITGPSFMFTNAQLHTSALAISGAFSGQVAQVTIRNAGVTITDGSLISLRNVAVSGSAADGIHVQGNSAPVSIRNCTIAVSGNQLRLGGAATVTFENNIAVAPGLNTFCILQDGGLLISDHNNLVARNGAWIGSRNGFWERLAYWQRESGQDLNSRSHEPLFDNESTGDLHLKSVTGRWSNGVFVADAVHSPSIDAGSPADATALEVAPNGGRINQGAYGGIEQASTSRTNAWLLALNFNDGGVVRGTNELRWAHGNLDTTNTVTIQYSTNGGALWISTATGIPATNSSSLWNSSGVTNSLAALWRVVLDGDTNTQDQTDNAFAIRNGVLTFYVNDTNTTGDIYTSAIGSPANNGLTPATPMRSISDILANYDTEGGDRILADTGIYNLTNDQLVIWSRGGDTPGAPLLISGSTNFAAGGTILSRGNTNTGIALDLRANHVTAQNLTLRNALRGVSVNSNTGTRVERVLAVSNEFGIVVTRANGALIANARLWNNREGGVDITSSTTVLVQNCTFVGNEPFAFSSSGSAAGTIQNNIFAVNSTNASALSGQLTGIYIDYNIYFFETNAPIHGTNFNLLAWQLAFGHDYRSAVTNPLFANAASGDFHERSTAGRFVDGTGFVTDALHSWAIDRGNNALPGTNEAAPSARINIGAYGNTPHASKGSTNVSFETRTLNDPTTITETNSLWPLIWTAQNVPTNELVRIQFSGDNGLTWTDLASGLSPYAEVLLWQTTPYYNTYRGRWRVIGTANTNILDASDARFEIFYGEFTIVSPTTTTNDLAQFTWRGAWGENYRVQYSTNLAANQWITAPTGAPPHQLSTFLSTNGGDFIFQDIHSATNRFRTYRVLREQF